MKCSELFKKIKCWVDSPPFPLPESIPRLQTLLDILTPNGLPIEAPAFISSPTVCLHRVKILFLLSDRTHEPNDELPLIHESELLSDTNGLGNETNHATLTDIDCDEITGRYFCDVERYGLAALSLVNVSGMVADELSDAMSVEMIRLSRFVESHSRLWVLRRFVEFRFEFRRLWHLNDDHQNEHDPHTWDTVEIPLQFLVIRPTWCDEFRQDLLSKFESLRWQANSIFCALRTTLIADVQDKMKQLQIARDLDEDLAIGGNSDSVSLCRDDLASPTVRIQGQPVEETITGGHVPAGGPDARRSDGSPTVAKSPKPKPMRRRRNRNNEKRDAKFYTQHYDNKMTIDEIVAHYNTRPGGKDQVKRDAVKKAIQRQAKRLEAAEDQGQLGDT